LILFIGILINLYIENSVMWKLNLKRTENE
jgi:hypothetical protein